MDIKSLFFTAAGTVKTGATMALGNRMAAISAGEAGYDDGVFIGAAITTLFCQVAEVIAANRFIKSTGVAHWEAHLCNRYAVSAGVTAFTALLGVWSGYGAKSNCGDNPECLLINAWPISVPTVMAIALLGSQGAMAAGAAPAESYSSLSN